MDRMFPIQGSALQLVNQMFYELETNDRNTVTLLLVSCTYPKIEFIQHSKYLSPRFDSEERSAERRAQLGTVK